MTLPSTTLKLGLHCAFQRGKLRALFTQSGRQAAASGHPQHLRDRTDAELESVRMCA